MSFIDREKLKTRSIAPGIEIRVASGARMMMSLVEMAVSSSIPLHQHPHEQVGMVLEGEFELVIGDERRVLRTGDQYVIPAGVLHGVPTVRIPSRALDIFSPPREDYA